MEKKFGPAAASPSMLWVWSTRLLFRSIHSPWCQEGYLTLVLLTMMRRPRRDNFYRKPRRESVPRVYFPEGPCMRPRLCHQLISATFNTRRLVLDYHTPAICVEKDPQSQL